jgi:hypothetical protein
MPATGCKKPRSALLRTHPQICKLTRVALPECRHSGAVYFSLAAKGRRREQLFNNNCVCTGRVPDPTSLFPPDLILYVNLVAKGAPKFFKTLAPRLTVLDIPYFADAYSRTYVL